MALLHIVVGNWSISPRSIRTSSPTEDVAHPKLRKLNLLQIHQPQPPLSKVIPSNPYIRKKKTQPQPSHHWWIYEKTPPLPVTNPPSFPDSGISTWRRRWNKLYVFDLYWHLHIYILGDYLTSKARNVSQSASMSCVYVYLYMHKSWRAWSSQKFDLLCSLLSKMLLLV